MTTMNASAIATLTMTELADMWHEAKANEAAADKIRKAAAKTRGIIAEECDARLRHGDVIERHGEAVGAVRPLVPTMWNVIEYDVTAKAAVLDALMPFFTPELSAMYKKLTTSVMVDGVETNKNVTHVRKLAFKDATA